MMQNTENYLCQIDKYFTKTFNSGYKEIEGSKTRRESAKAELRSGKEDDYDYLNKYIKVFYFIE